MKKILIAAAFGIALLSAPLFGTTMSVVYTDIANVFTANQRINAGLGVNTAPGATGTLSLSSGFFEYSRATKSGDWVVPVYNAANFTASAGTWTLPGGSANVFSYTYTLIGHTMILRYNIFNTNVSTNGVTLNIAVPGGFTCTTATATATAFASNAGGARTTTLEQCNAATNFVAIYADINSATFTATAGANTTVFGEIVLDVL